MKFRRPLLMSVIPVLLLVAAGSGWLHIQQQQYALNRQLIAALARDNTTQALELVMEGADSNTRLQPPPVPSFQLLFALVLHRSTLPPNISPTAFLLACGTDYEDKHMHCKDETKLVQAMLAHRADLHARTASEYTGLEGAIPYNHLAVTEWLLQNGANPNEQYADGGTPLWTPMRYAVTNENPAMVELLLAHHADLRCREDDKAGETMLDITYTHVQTPVKQQIRRLLRQAGAKRRYEK